MIMTASLRIHVGLDIPQTLSAGQLRHYEGSKLIPPTDLAQSLAFMVFIGEALKLMSRDQSEEL